MKDLTPADNLVRYNDSNVESFEISIQSLSPVDAEVLKRLIQERFKVVHIEKVSSIPLNFRRAYETG